jgi:hypothetical protein
MSEATSVSLAQLIRAQDKVTFVIGRAQTTSLSFLLSGVWHAGHEFLEMTKKITKNKFVFAHSPGIPSFFCFPTMNPLSTCELDTMPGLEMHSPQIQACRCFKVR